MIKSFLHIFVLTAAVALTLSLQKAYSDDPTSSSAALSHGVDVVDGAIADDSQVSQTPVELENLKTEMALTGHRPWQKPNFDNQDMIRGYKKEEFKIPAELKERVGFWIKIYTQYSTGQGVLHDSDDINFIFSELNFTEIDKREDLTSAKKRKMKEKFIDQKKTEITNRIIELQKIIDPNAVPAEDKSWWYQAQNIKAEVGSKADKIKKRIRFQLGQKDRFETALYLSGRYLQDFEQIFAEEGLPKELTRLVFVESSFNVLARSKVGASGLWQIMPYTARPYRYIKNIVDYRNEPVHATQLAAKVLKQSYDLLESWPLAITGYNHGPAGVKKLVEKYKSRDLSHLIENAHSRRSFGFASKNFYASFLAALEIEKNATQYFSNIVWSEKLPVFQVKWTKEIKFSEVEQFFDSQKNLLEISNPHISFNKVKKGTIIPAQTVLFFPEIKRAQIEDLLSPRTPASTSSSIRTSTADSNVRELKFR